MNQPALALNDSDKGELRDLTHRQDSLKERTQALHEKLESLFQLFPSLDPENRAKHWRGGHLDGQCKESLGPA